MKTSSVFSIPWLACLLMLLAGCETGGTQVVQSYPGQFGVFCPQWSECVEGWGIPLNGRHRRKGSLKSSARMAIAGRNPRQAHRNSRSSAACNRQTIPA